MTLMSAKAKYGFLGVHCTAFVSKYFAQPSGRIYARECVRLYVNVRNSTLWLALQPVRVDG